MKNSLYANSTFRALFLLNLLYEKELSKNEIIKAFKTQSINITKPTINNYIKKLSQNGIKISHRTIKKTNFYKIEKILNPIELNSEEINVLQEAKKLIILDKEYNRIRIMMRVFHKFAKYIKDNETKISVLDFGYYSTINWALVRQLENHCKNKDIIEFDYIMPDGSNKYLTMHAENIHIDNLSQRIYLNGVLAGTNKFSNLPVDRIYMVKKVIRKKARFKMYSKPIIYITTNQSIEKYGLCENETIIKRINDYCTVKTSVDDDFHIIQRLLNFCPDVYYISDTMIKKLYLEKLSAMKDYYDKKCDF